MVNLESIIPFELVGMRLDQALAQLFPEFSRAKLQSWISNQSVLVNNQPRRPKDRVQGGEVVVIAALLEEQASWQPQAIQLEIIYEDNELLIVNKPVGLVVHPAAGNPDSTLVNALLYHAPDLVLLPRAGIIHRLDKGTSGLLVVAKTLLAHTRLVRDLQARKIEREYAAVVSGVLIAGGTIDAPISRHPKQRTHMAVCEFGKIAVTHYRVVERFRAHTWVKVFLETGRTHQIRVHMAHIGHAIIGDATYGGRLQMPKGASVELQQVLRGFKHQALHARRLALAHPLTKESMEWVTPLPEDMQQLLEILRGSC